MVLSLLYISDRVICHGILGWFILCNYPAKQHGSWVPNCMYMTLLTHESDAPLYITEQILLFAQWHYHCQ